MWSIYLYSCAYYPIIQFEWMLFDTFVLIHPLKAANTSGRDSFFFFFEMSTKTEAVLQEQDPNDPYNVQYWSTRWTENRIGWHKTAIGPNLLKYIELVTGQCLTAEPLTDPVAFEKNSKLTWFVPLCGKTVDISYLLSQGFRVFALEGVKMAIDELDKEQSLDLEFDEKTSLYTGAGGRLKIYLGDLFQCPVEEFGPIDYVWDRGSFVAIEYAHRQAYSEVMQRALKGHKFRYLMETVSYDHTKFGGPPRSVSDSDMETYFGSWAKTEFLSNEKVPQEGVLFREVGGDAFLRIMLITPKE